MRREAKLIRKRKRVAFGAPSSVTCHFLCYNTQRSPHVGFSHRLAGVELETVSIKLRCVEIAETPMFFSDIGHVERFPHIE